MKDVKQTIDDVSLWLKNYLEKNNFDGYLLGLSGGIDSAVSLGLAVRSVGPEKVKCLALPCDYNQEHQRIEDVKDAVLLAKTFGVKLEIKNTLDIVTGNIYNTIENEIDNPSKLVLPNIKARVRMVFLRAEAESLNYLVLGTTNKTEEYLGYFTKAGDGGAGVDIEPIADFFKFEIRELARELGVPEKIITKSPSAGLWHDQTDEGEIGFKYDDIDKYLSIREEFTGKFNDRYEPTSLKLPQYKNISNDNKIDMVKLMSSLGKIKALNIDPRLIVKVECMIKSGSHKRNNPPYFLRLP